jgi:hypothetical protein
VGAGVSGECGVYVCGGGQRLIFLSRVCGDFGKIKDFYPFVTPSMSGVDKQKIML